MTDKAIYLVADRVKCSLCKVAMPAEKFATDRQKRNGLKSRCRECDSEYGKKYYWKNKERHRHTRREFHLRKTYKLDAASYQAILDIQGGGCAICGELKNSKNKSFMCVDHNHKTGAIRGILCDNCNFGIGNLKDDVKLLKNAIAYLQRSMGR